MMPRLRFRVRHWVRRWQELSGRERTTLLQAAALLPLARAAVRLLSPGAMRWLLARELRSHRERNSAAIRHRCEEVSRLVAIAAERGPVRARCLPRALTACLLLRRSGIAADLRLGGALKDGRFAAHAWLECEGEKFEVTRPPQPEFIPFDAPLAAPRVRS